MTTPSSVPAQGEAMRAVPAEQLQRWAELCEKGHGHAMAQEIRRALVAASPCAVNLGRIRECGPEYEAAAAQGGQQPDEEITEEMLRAADAAFHARDGHAARVVYAGIYRAMRAVAAPAAPLTEEQIIAIRQQTPDFGRGSYKPWSDTIGFARAIEAAHGITLAGTAGTKESADGR